jgi:thymidylate synthase (FAD)
MTVYTTKGGTIYLQSAQVALIGRTVTNLDTAKVFFADYGSNYLEEPWAESDGDGARLAKFAGQLCYLSIGDRRTPNTAAKGYFANIIAQDHTSVMEHCSYTFLLWGVSRALTHELVRHHVGVGKSQLSQRYVDIEQTRFVEAPEYAEDETLHRMFEQSIDSAAAQYAARASILYANLQDTSEQFRLSSPKDKRKWVNSIARRCLPNETEAPLIFSGNARAFRNIIEQRCTPHADNEIRSCMLKVLAVLKEVEPLLFDDL